MDPLCERISATRCIGSVAQRSQAHFMMYRVLVQIRLDDQMIIMRLYNLLRINYAMSVGFIYDDSIFLAWNLKAADLAEGPHLLVHR